MASSTTTKLFHTAVTRWFDECVGQPTDVQHQAWPRIGNGEHVLVTAPTGSGKTLTAFLYALNQLLTGAWSPGTVRVLYISPLKALNNDIQRNLIGPLEALPSYFEAEGVTPPSIHVMTRSGDTPADERRRMVRKPPEILITTPESLNLLLSSPKARGILRGVETVILDEIHAVAGTKRGTHLISAVERLVLLAGEFQRIALSATVNPLEAIAQFVGGYELRGEDESPRYRHRNVAVVASNAHKVYDLQIAFPHEGLYPPESGGRWPFITEAVKKIIDSNTSTLVFVNSRRVCERLSLFLNQGEDELIAYAHHGSLAREMRYVVEQRLKEGSLRALVATSSLELGIDIGALDEVVLVTTPPNVAATLQRLGRAGHQVGAVSRGVLYPTFAHDLLDAAVMAQAVADRDLEPTRPVPCPLDVLAQVIVSMTAVEPWTLDALYAFLRCCTPFHELTERQFDTVLAMLAGRYKETRIRSLQPTVTIDFEEGIVRAKGRALPVLYSSGGTITDRGYFNLRVEGSRAKIGELDEEFVWERTLGDRFTLGTQAWRIQQITHNDVFVTPVEVRRGDLPFWRAENQDRRFHLAERIAAFLEDANRRLADPTYPQSLAKASSMSVEAAQALVEYLQQQREAAGAPLPHRHHVLIERCTDHRRGGEHTQLVLHTQWGGAVNRPFALALSQAWTDAEGESLEVFADNNCVVVVLPQSDTKLDPFDLVKPDAIESLLRRRLEQSGFFGARFRENAGRALLLPKDTFGKRMPLWMSRIRSKNLLEAVSDFDDFPILAETWRTCLRDEFEVAVLRRLLHEVRDGVVVVTTIATTYPTPFAEGVVWSQTNKYMYMGDEANAPIKSNLSDELLAELVHNEDLRPHIDPELADAFRQKAQRVHPGYAPRDPDELAEWLVEREWLPASEWTELLAAMVRDHTVFPLKVLKAIEGKYVETDRGVYAKAFADRFARITGDDDEHDDDRLAWFASWLRFYGPLTKEELAERAPFGEAVLARLLESLVEQRRVVAGHLRRDAAGLEFCDTENLEILLRLRRRYEQPAVSARPLTALAPFLADWQGLGRRAPAPDGVAAALEPLLGLPIPADHLEKEFLPARIPHYTTKGLDELVTAGGLAWYGAGEKRIVLSPPESLDLFRAPREADQPDVSIPLPSRVGRFALADLLDNGDADSATLTQALWDATWSGAITNDSFQALRKGLETNFKPWHPPVQRRGARRAGLRAWQATRPFAGNWHAVPIPEPPEDELEAQEIAKERVRTLLARYGILFRELTQQELPELRWSALFRTLRLMELSGEIYTGHFFEGVPGMQFAGADGLRAFQEANGERRVYWLNATDPASCCGLKLDALRGRLPKRLKSTHFVYHGEDLVLVSEQSGKKLRIHCDPDAPELPEYLVLFRHLLTRAFQPLKAIPIDTINDEPSTTSPYLPVFRQHFDAALDPKRATLYRKAT